MVSVCRSCSDDTLTEPRREKYQKDLPDRCVRGGGPMVRQFSQAANRVTGSHDPVRSRSVSLRQVTPGYVLLRVPRSRSGRSIDSAEALTRFHSEPWFGELRKLGSDVRYHLFEYPRKANFASGVPPELERFRVIVPASFPLTGDSW